jgi:predicted dehydrogenase
VWDNDIAIGGGYVVSYDIHAIDAAVWALKRRPAAAMGRARVIRPQPHGGDSPDVFSVVYEYADGLIHEHFSQALPNRMQGELSCKVYTYNAQAIINYWGKAAYEIRGQKRVEKPVENLYDNGAMRNIATFHELVTNADVSNTTVPRAVDGCLACILGREAALRKREVTMDDLLKENKRIEPDRRGLKE